MEEKKNDAVFDVKIFEEIYGQINSNEISFYHNNQLDIDVLCDKYGNDYFYEMIRLKRIFYDPAILYYIRKHTVLLYDNVFRLFNRYMQSIGITIESAEYTKKFIF